MIDQPSELGLKIKKAIKQSDYNQAAVADEIGVSKQAVSGWIKTGKISRESLQKLADLLGLPVGWFSGAEVREPIPAYQIRAWHDEDDLDPQRDILVPVVDVTLSAGDGAQNPEYTETRFKLPFQAYWMQGRNLDPEKVMVMKVRGNSMAPTLLDEGSVLVDTTQTSVIDNKIYALATSRGALIKRLRLQVDGSLRIVSDNPDYDDEVIGADSQDHVHVIGRVIWFSGEL